MTKPSSPYSHSRHSLINGHGPLLAACQCTILAHFRHLTEIGSPPRMVRWPLWSPSAVCQCGRWFARLFRFRMSEDLLFALLVCHYHRSWFILLLNVFSFAKVVRFVPMPSTAGYFTQNYSGSLPQIAITIWVFRKILGKIPWRRLLFQPPFFKAKKRLKRKRSR